MKSGIFSIATEISVTLPAVPRDSDGKSSLELIFTSSSFDVLSPDRSVASITIFLLGKRPKPVGSSPSTLIEILSIKLLNSATVLDT